MKGVFLNGLGSAVPEHILDRGTALSFMKRFLQKKNFSDNHIEALFRASGIQKRYSFIQDYLQEQKFIFFPENKELEPFPTTADRMAFFRKKAPELAEKAINTALKHSSFVNTEITHLITVSCTGMYAPGLDLDLQRSLQLRTDLKRSNINFMGCYAAISALRMAAEISAGDKDAKILLVCLEACTLHFQKNDSEDNLLANALFGDGAAAAVVSSNKVGHALEISGFYAETKPSGSDEMAWNIGDEGFLMKLSSYVPKVINENILEFVENVKKELGINFFSSFAIHPGGKSILNHIKTQLGLQEEDMTSSDYILKNYGNMSSSSILFVLEHLLANTKTEKQRSILGMAFGPGLTFESVVLSSNA